MPRKKVPWRPAAPGRGGSKPGRKGQPAFEATAEQRRSVQALAASGASHGCISRVMRIAPATLTRHFQQEMTTGREDALAKVGMLLVEKALDGDLTALIYSSKALMGWRDRTMIAFDNGNGQAADPSGLFNLTITGLGNPPAPAPSPPVIEHVPAED